MSNRHCMTLLLSLVCNTLSYDIYRIYSKYNLTIWQIIKWLQSVFPGRVMFINSCQILQYFIWLLTVLLPSLVSLVSVWILNVKLQEFCCQRSLKERIEAYEQKEQRFKLLCRTLSRQEFRLIPYWIKGRKVTHYSTRQPQAITTRSNKRAEKTLHSNKPPKKKNLSPFSPPSSIHQPANSSNQKIKDPSHQ